MWRMSWSVAALTTFLAAQTWLAYAADGSLQCAKALFCTETGTTVAPKTDDRGPTTPPLQLHGDRVWKENVSRASDRPKASVTGVGVSKEPWLGIAYGVEWERPGAAPSRIADPSRFGFRSGDRIRFHVKTNVPGYLYVVNRGSSGRDTVLFLYVGMPDRLNRVEEQKEYAIPPRG